MPLRGQTRAADEAAVDEQIRLCEALEKGLKSRRRLTVQAMPYGCEIIDCESGDVVLTVALTDVAAAEKADAPPGWWQAFEREARKDERRRIIEALRAGGDPDDTVIYVRDALSDAADFIERGVFRKFPAKEES